MGSEMCIRDRPKGGRQQSQPDRDVRPVLLGDGEGGQGSQEQGPFKPDQSFHEVMRRFRPWPRVSRLSQIIMAQR